MIEQIDNKVGSAVSTITADSIIPSAGDLILLFSGLLVIIIFIFIYAKEEKNED